MLKLSNYINGELIPPINNEWWKKQYIYEKYIDNKNLSWWKKEFLINKFKL